MQELDQLEKAAARFNKDIQFHHSKARGITSAVLINFTKEDLIETVHHFDKSIVLMIGQSYLHPNDNYCKKTGRDLSSTRLKPEELKLACINQFNDSLHFVFTNDNFRVNIRVSPKSEKPHLLQVY